MGKSMKRLNGIAASRGIAIGQLFFYDNSAVRVEPARAQCPNTEWRRFECARRRAAQMLEELHTHALSQVSGNESMIFEIHQMMMSDDEYLCKVHSFITKNHFTAEYAVQQAGKDYEHMFVSMNDSYMQERAADVRDITKRLIDILSGRKVSDPSTLGSQFIIASHDMMPSDTIAIDKKRVLGILTRKGSCVSHAAILARTMGIPAVVGLGAEQYQQLTNKSILIVDGFQGIAILDPDERTLNVYRNWREEYRKYRHRLQRLKGVPNETRDGTKVVIMANIQRPEDVEEVMENDAQGIGLFRTECFYADSETPGEQVQFEAYRSVLERMVDRTVIVRTLDIGASRAHKLRLVEDNPAMGCRGIRASLRRPQLFAAQLRALLRASVFGHLAIMLPMVVSPDEVREVKSIMQDCKAELTAQGIPYAHDIPLGVLIETPAAAMTAAELAKEADFFSVGTNDLTQYTLAVDRANGSIGSMYDPCHPAVLRLIRLTAEAAAAAGIPCGICGEAAADCKLTDTFLAMGVTSLSVPPPMVLELREKIRSIDLMDREKILASL